MKITAPNVVRFRWKYLFLAGISVPALLNVSVAFPPAPCYTLHGVVRDQTGQMVRAQGASVILFKGTKEAGRAVIAPVVQVDRNYELSVRIDQARPATSLYNASAVASQGQFSLMVETG